MHVYSLSDASSLENGSRPLAAQSESRRHDAGKVGETSSIATCRISFSRSKASTLLSIRLCCHSEVSGHLTEQVHMSNLKIHQPQERVQAVSYNLFNTRAGLCDSPS